MSTEFSGGKCLDELRGNGHVRIVILHAVELQQQLWRLRIFTVGQVGHRARKDQSGARAKNALKFQRGNGSCFVCSIHIKKIAVALPVGFIPGAIVQNVSGLIAIPPL